MLEAARREGVQVIWDLCHYGWPDDLDIFSPAFVDRFARFCRAVARHHRETGDETPFYRARQRDLLLRLGRLAGRIMYPFARGRDGELKRQLVRAAIAGAEAIRDVDRARALVFPEPLIHTVPPRGSDVAAAGARQAREPVRGLGHARWAAPQPELGGDPKYLDIIGLNYYAANQWEVPGGAQAALGRPARATSAGCRSTCCWRRSTGATAGPLFIAETSHYGAGRAAWIREVAGEVSQAREQRRAAGRRSASTPSSTASTGTTPPTGTTAACSTWSGRKADASSAC